MSRRIAPPLLAALALAAACRRDPPAGAPDGGEVTLVPQATIDAGEARVVVAAEEVLRQPVVAAGRVAFDDQRVQHVLSPVAGRISRVLAQPGQAVEKGTPLVAIVSPEVGAAFADVVKAEADLGQAGAELARQQRLVAAHAGPARDLEAAEDAERRARAELARARQKAALLRAGDVDAVTQELTLRAAIPGEDRRRMGIFSLARRQGSVGWNKLALATVWNCKSTAGDSGSVCRHDYYHQAAPGQICRGNYGAARLARRRNLHRRVAQDL